MSLVEQLAERLDEAERRATATTQPNANDGELDLTAAYETQRLLVERRLARGEQYVGPKLGFTSKAKMEQMGVSDVIVGRLTDRMRIADGGTLWLDELIHPRIEPEVVFRLGRDIDPQDPDVDIEACVDAVAPGLEVIDSRYENFRFSLPDVVADNTSAARYVIGPWCPVGPGALNLAEIGNRGVLLEVDGALAETGSTAAILGHPVRALHALRDMAARHGIDIPGGSVVLAGAATAAVALTAPGYVEATVTGLGRVGLRIDRRPA